MVLTHKKGLGKRIKSRSIVRINSWFDKYLDDLEAAEDWPGRVGDYIVRQAVSYYEIRMEYTPETESVLIHIVL